ncbi:hypothetical protein A6C57_07030 [Fibrella sp. ES10-3-2-2]|nr:hypothetical protein A6C57_07030 [Fibrella sp. ES10-3-2-2]
MQSNALADRINNEAFCRTNWQERRYFNQKTLGLEGITLFQYLVHYCAMHGSKHEGWYYHSRDDIAEETAISRRRLESTVALFVDAGILETKLTGVPPRLHYRLRFDKLAEPAGMAFVYRNLTPQQEKQISTLFHELAIACNQPDQVPPALPEPAPTPSQPVQQAQMPRPTVQQVNQLLHELERLFTQQLNRYRDQVNYHQVYSPGSKLKHLPRVDYNWTGSELAGRAAKALTIFSAQQIKDAALVYYDCRNFHNGGTPPRIVPPPVGPLHVGRHPLRVLLAADKFEFLHACVVASRYYSPLK